MRLILLPGMDGDGALLRNFQRALQKALPSKIISYPSDIVLGYEELEMLVRVELRSEAEPTIIVAESFSGPVAIRLAANPPVVLRGMVLVATFSESPVPRLARFLVNRHLFRSPLPAAMLRKFMLGRSASTELVDEVRVAIRSVEPKVLAGRLKSIFDVDVSDELDRISLPGLYIQPTDDMLVRRPLLVRDQGGWRCRSVSGPHLVLQTCPEKCAKLVHEFIDEFS